MYIILQCFIICEDDGNSNEHPPGYEYLADDYLMPSLDEEKGRYLKLFKLINHFSLNTSKLIFKTRLHSDTIITDEDLVQTTTVSSIAAKTNSTTPPSDDLTNVVTTSTKGAL